MLSVIMPVYNQEEECLREAIESILNQTYTDYEFIIINDGSTNTVEDVVLSYNDNRIKYVKQKNQGISCALNNAIDIAKGEYIARMDSDDISLPERFEKQLQFFKENPDVSILGTACEKFPAKEEVFNPENVDILTLIKGCYLVHPTVMFKKADFDKYNLRYDSSFSCEDYELWSRAIRYLKICNLNEILLRYRWNGKNISSNNEKLAKDYQKVRENLLNFISTDITLHKHLIDIATGMYNESFINNVFSIKRIQNKQIIRLLGFKITRKIKGNE